MTAILLIVGIAEPLGIILSMPTLRALGRISSSSNAPLVFNQVGGIEFWANSFRFVLRDRDGRVVEMPITNDDVGRIRGPHTRTAAYIVPIGLGPIAGPDFYLPPLRYGLCDHGPLARDLGYLGDLDQATIVVSSRNPGAPRSWILEVACPR